MQQATTLACLLFIQPMASQVLPNLFSSQISDAQSLAKCLSIPNLPEQTQCYDVCKIVQQNPMTDLCRYPHLCSGGCKVRRSEKSILTLMIIFRVKINVAIYIEPRNGVKIGGYLSPMNSD